MSEPQIVTDPGAVIDKEAALAAVDRALDGSLPDPELDDLEDEDPELEAPAMEVKLFRGGVREVKEATRNGVSVGIVTGYLSTWAPDTGGRYGVPDKFEPGAWTKSLAEHRARGSRQVRLKDHHGRTIGGFPIDTMREDATGLYGAGEINLETQAGREGYSLAKQGVITDFSVGFVPIADKVETLLRRIFEAILLEGSIVDEPANQGARILEVKRVALYRSLEAKAMTIRDFERALHESGAFSRKAARILAARLSPAPAAPVVPLTSAEPRYDESKMESILRDLKASARVIAGS